MMVLMMMLGRGDLGLLAWLLTKDFLEGKRGCLCEELVHFEEQVAEVELTAPLRVVLTIGPLCDEIVLDPIVLLHVVEQFNDGWVRGFVQVDVRRDDWILGWEEELEADRSHLIL